MLRHRKALAATSGSCSAYPQCAALNLDCCASTAGCCAPDAAGVKLWCCQEEVTTTPPTEAVTTTVPVTTEPTTTEPATTATTSGSASNSHTTPVPSSTFSSSSSASTSGGATIAPPASNSSGTTFVQSAGFVVTMLALVVTVVLIGIHLYKRSKRDRNTFSEMPDIRPRNSVGNGPRGSFGAGAAFHTETEQQPWWRQRSPVAGAGAGASNIGARRTIGTASPVFSPLAPHQVEVTRIPDGSSSAALQASEPIPSVHTDMMLSPTIPRGIDIQQLQVTPREPMPRPMPWDPTTSQSRSIDPDAAPQSGESTDSYTF